MMMRMARRLFWGVTCVALFGLAGCLTARNAPAGAPGEPERGAEGVSSEIEEFRYDWEQSMAPEGSAPLDDGVDEVDVEE